MKAKNIFALREPLAWCLLGTVVFAVSYSLNEPLENYYFGAWGWPAAIALLILGCGLCQMISILGVPYRKKAAKGAIEPESSNKGKEKLLTRLIGFLLPLSYVFLIDTMGFLLITPFFLIGYMYVLGLKKWPRLLLNSLGMYVITVIILQKVLFTPFPPGVSFFYTLNRYLIYLFHYW